MKENLNDLRAFLSVAQTGSFTKAAAQMGVSPSALSHSIKGIEGRLQIKLFHRTTRSTSPTEAGAKLYRALMPLFDEIDDKINELGALRDTLSGSLKINMSEHALSLVLKDKFLKFQQTYPDVALELIADNAFVDIVAGGFDAGVRLGADVAKDMVAVRISPDMRMAALAAPGYLAGYGTPKTPHDLTAHTCLKYRLSRLGNVMAWEFWDKKAKKTVSFQPSGNIVSNRPEFLIDCAVQGLGVIWFPFDSMKDEIAQGKLVEILPNWAITYDGYHLYYPSRKHHSPLFAALVECLRE